MRHNHGRVAVITGASSGIGRATALKFAKNGYSVIVAARRKGLLRSLAEECEKFGSEALPVETDVSDERSVEKLARSAVKKFGHIDVWINNAGIGAVGTFHDVKPEEHRRVIETNVVGTMNGSWHALRQFKKQREGVLINISSVLGKVTQPYMGSYSASKHGVRALSGSIRQELWLKGLKNIHVCTVFPQSVDTPFFRNEANRSGYKLKPAPPVETPEHAAAVIFDLAENPQDEVHVGKMGKFMAAQQKLARGITEKEMASMTERKHFDRGRRERPSSGSLWRTDRSDEGNIRGGWKNGSTWRKPVSVAGVAAPAALGLYLVLKNRRSSQLREVA